MRKRGKLHREMMEDRTIFHAFREKFLNQLKPEGLEGAIGMVVVLHCGAPCTYVTKQVSGPFPTQM